jgi:isocitrate dehydrogenase
LAKDLRINENKIIEELNEAQGKPTDIGGYYLPDEEKVSSLMRPSRTFNEALASNC